MSDSVYAPPRQVTDLSECVFYHTMELPGIGLVQGQFDLRGREAAYLGHVDFDGKRVLEIGPANGHLSLYMERQGAEVVSCDLSRDCRWDFVPYATVDPEAVTASFVRGIEAINNGYWLAHRLHGSKNRVVYASVYDIPDGVGTFDVGTLSATLLHMENPFRAIASVARRVRETMIVTEVLGRRSQLAYRLGRWFKPVMWFLPDAKVARSWNGQMDRDRVEQCMVWWALSPDIVQRFLGVVGFEDTTVQYHRPLYRQKELLSYTVVARRTVPMPDRAVEAAGEARPAARASASPPVAAPS